MPTWAIILISVVAAAALIGVAVWYIRKNVKGKVAEQKTLVNQHKMPASIFVINKKKAKITDVSLPKSVQDQVPSVMKVRKLPIVTAKVGSQIMPLIADDKIFDSIPEKKNIKVEIAGIFIVSIAPEYQLPTKKKKKKAKNVKDNKKNNKQETTQKATTTVRPAANRNRNKRKKKKK